MSQNGENSRDGSPQEDTQGRAGLSSDVAAEMASQVQGPNARQQAGGDNEPSDAVEIICREVRKILTELKEQAQVEDHYMSTIQEPVGAKMTEAVEEFVKTARRCFDDKRKAVWEIVSEINAALQRTAENDKMLEAVKAAMETTWNALL